MTLGFWLPSPVRRGAAPRGCSAYTGLPGDVNVQKHPEEDLGIDWNQRVALPTDEENPSRVEVSPRAGSDLILAQPNYGCESSEMESLLPADFDPIAI